jgi:precorrin-2/cobalt-factor-2 C20-methyltransferase
MNKQTGKFFGVGVGPGDPELLTIKAKRILESADTVFAVKGKKDDISISGKIVEGIGIPSEKIKYLKFSMLLDKGSKESAWKENASIIAGELKEGRDVAFVTIGDPLIYSTCIYVMRELETLISEPDIEIVPGITSFQVAAAKSKTPLAEDTETMTLVPAYSKEILENSKVLDSDNIVIMKAYKSRGEIVEYITSQGDKLQGVYTSRLGLDRETITKNINEVSNLPEEYLSMFLVKRTKDE